MHLLATSRRPDINHLRLCCIFNATECFCLHKLCLYLFKFNKEKLIKRNLEKKRKSIKYPLKINLSVCRIQTGFII